jgi:thiol-disulfide isomerase/thioredoxin
MSTVLSGSNAAAAQATAGMPAKKQLPADERAYKAARKINDPAQCLAALRAFVHDYPKSSRAGRAQDAILAILLKSFPTQTTEIESQVNLLVKQAGKGESRYYVETDIAFQMAEAGTNGVDLPLAGKLAKDAADQLNEANFTRLELAAYVKFKAPAPKPAEIHAQFVRARAEALAVLGNIKLRQGQSKQSATLVDEAYGLDPLVDDVNTMRGRLAILNHHDDQALESFERAQLLGAISAADKDKMMELYASSHNGNREDFDAEMDARYAKLFPASFEPEKPQSSSSGHTVLLELFTGSACPPCIGGDLAVEGLLKAYPRSELVVLALDQHVPEPDPLTNPDTVARAEYYETPHTPQYVIDGQVQSIYGSTREGSHELYTSLAKAVDGEAALPTGVVLNLTASRTPGGQVEAHAEVTLPGSAEIKKALAAKPLTEAPAAAAESQKTAPAATPTPEPLEPTLILNFALVEDEIRYSGENGIRFHRMVVRSLAKPADSGYPLDNSATSKTTAGMSASFDPTELSRSLVTYLDNYEQQNDKFGQIKFLTKDMTMRPEHLAIAAWVQDSTSHRVLQAAFVPLTANETASK